MTPEGYLDRVRALLPVLQERAALAEQLRRLPDETFADFQQAGLFRALQPRRYGGYELDPGSSTRQSWKWARCAGRAPGCSGLSGCTTGIWRSFRRKRKKTSGAKTPASNSRPRWRRPAR